MKTALTSFLRRAAKALLVVGLAGVLSAHAQIILSFSQPGGAGTALTVTLASPVTYTIGVSPTNNGSGNMPFFVFQGVGNLFGTTGGISLASAPTYSINGSGTFNINSLTSQQSTVGNIVANDIFFSGSSNPSLFIGNTVTLNAGTFITVPTYNGIVPTNGSYATFITDGQGNNLGGGASAVPEPATYAALAGAAMLGLTIWRRRRAVAVEAV